jgi:hypothetical protein
LNFAPAPLSGRLGVKVKTVDLTTSLESLAYFLAQPGAARMTSNLGGEAARGTTHPRRRHEL